MIDAREFLNERAAIAQYDGGLSRREAELLARELLAEELKRKTR